MGMASIPFPLVGIGASAGGLEALQRLLPALPPEPGFAIVIVLHLAPDTPSVFAEALQRSCDMRVVQVVQHPTELRPNHVYVIAPGTLLKVEDHFLFLDEAGAGRTTLGAIDYFFHSLALSHRHMAVGVLLSGMGHDGCGGLAALREQGGATIVQAPDDAQFGALPEAAIEASQADIVLSAPAIGERLLVLCSAMARAQATEAPRRDEAQALQYVLQLLHERTGHDFRNYKRPTILRRLEHRLQLHGVGSVEEYCGLIERDGDEARKLMKDFLIGVTGFFRDPTAFERLEQAVLPAMLQTSAGGELRAWVAACSTGQEAYSLAILLAEMARNMTAPPRIHIFATDIDEQALGVARAGLYPASIADEVPAASLERYFVRSGKQFRVRQGVREMITFASHNLLRDPPFSGLDLVTCRNFMIYLDRVMQRHVLQRFHFGLASGGYLFLGSAESADLLPELFAPVDRASRIYRARVVEGRQADSPAANWPVPRAPLQRRISAAAPVHGSAAQADESLQGLRERLAQAESGWEELQSNNEELSTLNAELKARLEETGSANDDLNNLIGSVDLATVFVDPGLLVKRFTPRAATIFNLIPRDVGRSLLDITHRLDYPDMASDVARTFDTLQPMEREVSGTDGRHYIARIRPYRTGEDTIAGTVLTFFDISQRREAERAARAIASDQEFLLRLGDSLRPLGDPMQLLALGCRLLGERLAVTRLAYAEIREERYGVLPGFAAGATPLQGEGAVDMLESAALASWRAGEIYAVPDLSRMPDGGNGDEAQGLSGLAGRRGALLAGACRKGERWLGFYLACQDQPREWRHFELTLFAEAIARIGVEFERARAQAALQASEVRLRALLRGLAHASWETDATGEGSSNWLDAVHPDDRSRAQDVWRAAVHTGTAMETEIRLQRPGRKGHRASMLATPLLDEQGDVRNWSGCIIDIDERPAAPSGSI